VTIIVLRKFQILMAHLMYLLIKPSNGTRMSFIISSKNLYLFLCLNLMSIKSLFYFHSRYTCTYTRICFLIFSILINYFL